MSNEICPVCGKGVLIEQHDTTTLQPGGIIVEEITVERKYSICDHCESEVTDGKQSRFNQAQVLKQTGTI